MEKKFSHLDATGQPTMVDVSQKQSSTRIARAQAKVIVPLIVLEQLESGDIQTAKGPVFHTAILAGVMAAKQTSQLIPLCHPLPISSAKIWIEVNQEQQIVIECEVKVDSKTGVEMEALTGASIAALTIYDMCKAFTHEMIIQDLQLLKKTGGKSDYQKA
ncbi:MAG: cyclic pyranopterin monophosphate synthase MoaC [Bacteroidota bacterium]